MILIKNIYLFKDTAGGSLKYLLSRHAKILIHMKHHELKKFISELIVTLLDESQNLQNNFKPYVLFCHLIIENFDL